MSLVRRSASSLATPSATPAPTKSHAASSLGFGGTDQAVLFARLSPAVLAALAKHSGEEITSWVEDSGCERPFAVRVGQSGAAIATPFADAPSWSISAYHVDPSSWVVSLLPSAPPRSDLFASTTAPPASSAPALENPSPFRRALLGSSVQAEAPAAEAPAFEALGLSDALRGFLGHLPADVQAFVQRPFLAEPILRGEYYYKGKPADLEVMLLLAGKSSLVVVTGHLTKGGTLSCARAQVTSRVGKNG